MGGLLTIENQLGYPRSFNLVVLGIYDLFVIIRVSTVVVRPYWLTLFLPLVAAEVWINGGLFLLLFSLSLALVLGIISETDPKSTRRP